jgi:hypothetical protein
MLQTDREHVALQPNCVLTRNVRNYPYATSQL